MPNTKEISTPNRLPLMARFNRWANAGIYGCCEGLDEESYRRDRKAFFGSIHNTLNHILVVDRLWISRMDGTDSGVKSLEQILFDDFTSLKAARKEEDERLIDFTDALTEGATDRIITYRTTEGEAREQPADLILATLYNHQTHHRGQVHALLTQQDVTPPPLDVMVFLAEPD